MKHIIKPILIATIIIGIVKIPITNITQDITLFKDISEQSKVYNYVEDDLKHSISILKDLAKIIKKESDYESGYGVIRGTTSVGSTQNIASEEHSRDALDSQLEEVTLVSVVDGDTLTILAADGYEYKVRLIGVDTPESVNPDESKNNEYGVIASKNTKELLADIDTLYLEYDVSKIDRYGRLLAYVWFTQNVEDINNMLNARIVAEGYAEAKEYAPNTMYATTFSSLCNTAKSNNIGLWQYEGYRDLVRTTHEK